MREIKSGDITIAIRASNLARTFFYQEFNTDLDAELAPIMNARSNTAKQMLAKMSQEELKTIMSMGDVKNMDIEQAAKTLQDRGLLDNKELSDKLYALALTALELPGMNAMRLTWAMNAAQNFKEGKNTLPFDKWVEEFDDFNFSACMSDIIAECDKGFFR